MKVRLKFGFVLTLIITLVLAGCSKEEVTSSDKLKVAASIYPMYAFASKVGGDYAEVTLLVSEGMEPHDWEPAPQDLAMLERSEVLIYNGSGMEGWLDQVVASLDNENLMLVETSHGLELLASQEGHEDEEHEDEHGHEDEEHEDEHAHEDEEHEDDHAHEDDAHDHDHGEFDPHVWLSPIHAIEQVRSIEAAFASAAPEHKEAFKKNAEAFIAELEELNNQFSETLAPHKGKEFVTQHAAFAYLAHQYDLVQLPIAGLSPENEPSAERMAEIVEFSKEHGISTIFFETLISSKVAEVIANEIGAKTSVLHPLEYRTKDEQEQGMDYIKLMEQNLNALNEAFESE